MKTAAAVAVVVLLTAVAATAQARLIDLHAGMRAGGITGWGSTPGTPDFFDQTRGAALGAEVGVKILVLDLSVSFLQVFDSAGRSGTLSQAILGFEIDIPLGQASTSEGRRKLILRPGAGGGVAFGTPRPVASPLTSDQVSDKGVVSQARVALEYNPHPLLGFGVEGDLGYHYFVGGQIVQTSSNSLDHSSGVHVAALATLTFHLGY